MTIRVTPRKFTLTNGAAAVGAPVPPAFKQTHLTRACQRSGRVAATTRNLRPQCRKLSKIGAILRKRFYLKPHNVNVCARVRGPSWIVPHLRPAYVNQVFPRRVRSCVGDRAGGDEPPAPFGREANR
jgi:hypothetical protein